MIMLTIVYFYILSTFLLTSLFAREPCAIRKNYHLISRKGAEVRGSVPSSQSVVIGFRHNEQGLESYSRRPRGALSPRKPRASMLLSRDVSHPILPPGGDIAINTGEWVMRFIWVESGIPTEVASAILRLFYQRLLELVDQKIEDGDIMRFASLHVVNLYLDFECDSPVISWDFIRGFLIRILDATERGFTGRFLATLQHGPSQSLIRVAFRILAPQAPSENTGSN